MVGFRIFAIGGLEGKKKKEKKRVKQAL